ncbi:MAG: hypothetical protein WA707_06090, partial [Pseudolabrys sp.]
ITIPPSASQMTACNAATASAGPFRATTRLMHRSNDEAMSSFRQACGVQSPGGYLIAEFWA